jgi:hypothetical protein
VHRARNEIHRQLRQRGVFEHELSPV